MKYDHEVWDKIPNEHLWVYDKLILSRKLGYLCGPAGVSVPKKDFYCVKPITNMAGLGVGSSIMELTDETFHLPPGTFWQTCFKGRHLSFDFKYGNQVRCSEGFATSTTRFSRWLVTQDVINVPDFILSLISQHEHSNIETIGGNIIEIHLRDNPDFDDNALEIIPVWNDYFPSVDNRFTYIPDADGDRLGFYKRYN